MKKTSNLVMPFLKWVGGKRQLLKDISDRYPSDIARLHYYEPFIGGGACYFNLLPKKATINDLNEELVNAYRVVRDEPDSLVRSLSAHLNEEDYFYELRNLDRSDEYKQKSNLFRASRLIYLNKTCFNGLYRVNNSGEFNTPFGRYKNPNIVNEPVIRAVSTLLKQSDTEICNYSYKKFLKRDLQSTFFYLDPPYDPVSKSSNFTGYISGGWGEAEQIELRDFCLELTRKGAKLLLSNSDTPFIGEIYRDFFITTVEAKRSINSVGKKRGNVSELLISNYEQ